MLAHRFHRNAVIFHAPRELMGLKSESLRELVIHLGSSEDSLHRPIVGHLDLVEELRREH